MIILIIKSQDDGNLDSLKPDKMSIMAFKSLEVQGFIILKRFLPQPLSIIVTLRKI